MIVKLLQYGPQAAYTGRKKIAKNPFAIIKNNYSGFNYKTINTVSYHNHYLVSWGVLTVTNFHPSLIVAT
jgi:hypothetical protein